MSEDRFDQINKLIDALVAQCELVDVEQAGLAECVDLIGETQGVGAFGGWFNDCGDGTSGRNSGCRA